MRQVLLYGKMRKKFGKSYQLDVNTPAEAIHALMCVVEGFRSWFTAQAKAGAQYHVFCGRRNVNEQACILPAKDDEPIRIVPVVSASKNSVLSVVAGAGLVVAAALSGNPYLFAAGFGLLVGGILAMKMPAASTNEREETRPSYIFDGSVNTEAAGHPYPILYGKMICGSAVVSEGLYTSEYPIV